MNKKIFTAIVLASVMLSGVAIGVGGYETVTASLAYPISVKYNGEIQTMTDATGARVYPIAYNGTTYLPVRAVGNMLGLTVDWDQEEQTVLLTSAEPLPEAVEQVPVGFNKNVTYYTEFPTVPDFGVLAGVSTTREYLKKVEGTTKVYMYDIMGFEKSEMGNYIDLLKSEEFQYVDSFYGDGTNLVFKKGNIDVTVGFMDGDFAITISVKE